MLKIYDHQRRAGPTQHPDNPMLSELDLERRYVGNANALKNSGPFDFIVVGAGAGGCGFVSGLANEIERYKLKKVLNILLVEAGPEAQNSPHTTIPNRAMGLWRSEIGRDMVILNS
jgi:hypothetical protein